MFTSKKDNDKCVCVNVFAECGKEGCCDNEDWYEKEKGNDCCVCINVFAKCNKKDGKHDDHCKCDECCVEINIFAECEKKKAHKPCGCEEA